MAKKSKANGKEKRKRVKHPSFVVELPLQTNPEDHRLLCDRLWCATRLSNVLLQQGIAIVTACVKKLTDNLVG